MVECSKCGKMCHGMRGLDSHYWWMHTEAGAAQRAKLYTPIVHGTTGGYQKHLARKEKPCTPCRKAHNMAVGKWKRGWARRWIGT